MPTGGRECASTSARSVVVVDDTRSVRPDPRLAAACSGSAPSTPVGIHHTRPQSGPRASTTGPAVVLRSQSSVECMTESVPPSAASTARTNRSTRPATSAWSRSGSGTSRTPDSRTMRAPHPKRDTLTTTTGPRAAGARSSKRSGARNRSRPGTSRRIRSTTCSHPAAISRRAAAGSAIEAGSASNPVLDAVSALNRAERRSNSSARAMARGGPRRRHHAARSAERLQLLTGEPGQDARCDGPTEGPSQRPPRPLLGMRVPPGRSTSRSPSGRSASGPAVAPPAAPVQVSLP